jgi:hypothetical protein
MELIITIDVATKLAEKMTLGGNRRQFEGLPKNYHTRKSRHTWVWGKKPKTGTVNACGKWKNNCNAFLEEGLDVRREISCH